MKKRLRKKHHRREFAIYAVSLKASFASPLDEADFGKFVDEFVTEAIEARGLLFGGGGHPESGWEGVIEPKSKTTRIAGEDIDWVRAWMEKRREIDSFEISDAWDLWHGKNPFGE